MMNAKEPPRSAIRRAPMQTAPTVTPSACLGRIRLRPSVAAWLAVCCAALPAAELRVGSGETHETIGAALAAARIGDTIHVLPGTYRENLVWPRTQGLKLIAERGPDETILAGNGKDPVIHMEGKLKWDTRIEGFTIRDGGAGNAAGQFGAGLNILGASPTIRNCRITANAARPYRGSGGIFLRDSRAVVEHNEIAANAYQSERLHAGGVCVWGGMPKIRFNRLEGNKGDDERFFTRGAGLRLIGSKALVEGNLVRNNIATSVGSALCAEQGDRSAVFGNLFAGNRCLGGSSGAVVVAPNSLTQVGGARPREPNAIQDNIHLWMQAVVKEERIRNLHPDWQGVDGRSFRANWWGGTDAQTLSAQLGGVDPRPESAPQAPDAGKAGLER